MRPEGYSLDRIDPHGNYEPGNLRWADRKTQANNIRDPEGKSAKIGAAHKGKTVSPETRTKMSAAKTGTIPTLNIETDEVKRIPKELYYSRRDIYYHTNSKKYKTWRQSNEQSTRQVLRIATHNQEVLSER